MLQKLSISSINKKKMDNLKLTKDEIDFFVKSLHYSNRAPDYLISSWLTAVYINNLDLTETSYLTQSCIDSGEVIDFSSQSGIIIDKHSTGGVGDKLTLVFSPIVAALGLKVAKLSGRGLGFTGGTVDKLESIGVHMELSHEQMNDMLNQYGMFISGASENIAPADKVLYSIRDVTQTIGNWGLITASILSKKFSLINTHVYLDVKYGSGAFCKTPEDVEHLVKYLKAVTKKMNRKLTIIVSSMEQPLGFAIGNAIEVKESIEFLNQQKEIPDLKQLVYESIETILIENKKCKTKLEADKLIDDVIDSKKALNKFYEWIDGQGGDLVSVKNNNYFRPKYSLQIKSNKDGYLNFSSTDSIGKISNKLGAGRVLKTDKVDFHAGILLNKKIGDKVKRNELLATLYSSKPINKDLIKEFLTNCEFKTRKIQPAPIIKKVIYND